MQVPIRRRSLLGLLTAALANLGLGIPLKKSQAADLSAPINVLIVVGPSSHPPGTHEVAAGAKVMRHCLENIDNAGLSNIRATIVDHFPTEVIPLENVASVVFIGDHFPLQKMPETDKSLAVLGDMMNRGCGIVCIHYATGLRAEDVQADGEHPLLHWIGGYFATKCKHHQSVARVFKQATIEPVHSDHPVSRGWNPFTVNDEPYINNFFSVGDNKPAEGVIEFATSMLPPEAPRREVVAWGIERQDSGRGFAIVMPHFYRNWSDNDLRCLILNGIVWSAHRDVPENGVRTSLGGLSRFLAKEPE